MIDLENIKKKRKEKKITLKEMAIALGFETPSSYFKVESGNVKLLAEHIPIICKMLEMETDEIIK
jgi:transcriptional regulator with XRE-family HTH domain